MPITRAHLSAIGRSAAGSAAEAESPDKNWRKSVKRKAIETEEESDRLKIRMARNLKLANISGDGLDNLNI